MRYERATKKPIEALNLLALAGIGDKARAVAICVTGASAGSRILIPPLGGACSIQLNYGGSRVSSYLQTIFYFSKHQLSYCCFPSTDFLPCQCFRPLESTKFFTHLSLHPFNIMKHLLALSLGTFALGTAEFSMMSILVPAATNLGVSIPQAGHFISAYAFGVCVGVILMVLTARKFNLRTLLLILAGLMIVGNSITLVAQGYWTMCLGRFLAGLPHGCYFGAGAIIVQKLAQPGKAARDVSLMVAGMTIANLVSVPLGSLLAWAISWRAVFAIVVVADALVFTFLRLWVPSVPADPDKGFFHQFRFLSELSPWLILLAIGLGNGGFFAYYSYVNPIMEHVAHIPASLMSVVIGVAGLGMVAGNLFAARLSTHFSSQALAFSGQFILFLCLVFLFAFAWQPAIAIAFTTLAAACVFFISGPEQILLLEGNADGKLLAAAMGQVAFNFGNAIGAWLGGLPIASGKTEQWSAIPGMGLAGIGALLLLAAWLIYRERKAQRLADRYRGD